MADSVDPVHTALGTIWSGSTPFAKVSLSFVQYSAISPQICEVVDLLVLLLENYSNKQDQLYLLMFEPEVGELLYGLLTIKGYTIVFYEKIVKVRELSDNVLYCIQCLHEP